MKHEEICIGYAYYMDEGACYSKTMKGGRIDFCGWIAETLNVRDFIYDEKVDWKRLLNSPEYKAGRKGVLEGNYPGCMECCPMIIEK